jgi:PAS domain S-box-containing protein
MDSHQNSQAPRNTSSQTGSAANPDELPLRSSGPIRIAMTYLILGLLWIWISDFSLVRMDIQSLAAFWAAAGKGSLFVIASSVLVFFLVYRDYATVLKAVGERRKANEKLVSSEKRYRQLVDLLPTAVCLQSQEKITFCNPAFLKLMCASHEREVLGKSPFDIVHPEYHSLVRERIARMYETRKQVPEVEMRIVRLDGKEVPVYSIATLVLNSGNAEILVAMTDLSERHHLESQIQQAQRIEAIGRLAGGIAHDFNNLLTVINGYSELLTPGADPTSIEYVAVSAIREAGTRAASLTSQLLTLSRRAIVSPVVLDLNQQLRQSEKLLRCLIGEDILMTVSLDPNLGRIKADPGQLDQVVMNLAVNARDAMPTGGQLRIETRATKLNLNGSDEDSGPDSELKAFSELTVSDTGCGIARENLQAIFDPFFTTKEPGKGTGLGLSVVDGIIRQAGGFILADSEVGKGSLFRIWFPVVNEPVSLTDTDSAATMSSVIQTILLVEDEAAVRNVVQTGLESFGYRVIVAGSAIDAIQLMQVHGPEIDLLITDVVMPGMSGRQLSDQLRIPYPNLKILFVSGYTDDAVVRHGVEDSSDILLLKPFTPAELAQRIKTLFDDAEQLPTAIEQS